MKKYVTSLFLMLVIPLALLSQMNPLDGFLKDYKGQDGVFFMDMSTNMLSACKEGEAKDVNMVINLKILSFDKSNKSGLSAKELSEAFFSQVNRDNYIGLVEVKSPDENVEIMVKKENKSISELILVARDDSKISFIAASGNFDLKDLASLKGMQNCSSLKLLGQMCEE